MVGERKRPGEKNQQVRTIRKEKIKVRSRQDGRILPAEGIAVAVMEAFGAAICMMQVTLNEDANELYYPQICTEYY